MTIDITSSCQQWFGPQSAVSRGDLLRERFSNFQGHRLSLAALTDDFPLVFHADASSMYKRWIFFQDMDAT